MTQSSNGKCAEEYVVKRGDSFYLIAHKLGVPLRDLLAANRDIHPARLMVGDVLCIPREEDDSPDSGGLGGDTTTDPDNGTTDPDTPQTLPDTTPTEPAPDSEATPACPVDEQWIIQRGQTVADVQLRNMVSRHTLDVANPNVDLENLRTGQTICIPEENIPCDVPATYTILQSETLEAVAMKFNLPVASLLRANPCLAPQDFEAGVTITLPS